MKLNGLYIRVRRSHINSFERGYTRMHGRNRKLVSKVSRLRGTKVRNCCGIKLEGWLRERMCEKLGKSILRIYIMYLKKSDLDVRQARRMMHDRSAWQ